MQDLSLFDLKEIYKARKRIRPYVSFTPLQVSEGVSESLGSGVRLKLENQQVTGAFKLRGAANKILQLSEEQKGRGVITVSSGNHGRAVAYISRELGLKAVIVISEAVPENKREAIRRLGAELLVGGPGQDEAMDFAGRLQKERGLSMVHPFDDLQVIAGQGTIALELLEEYPELDTVLVPLSGGGLCGGIAFTLKTVSPRIRVVGVSQELGPAMIESIKAGRVTGVVEEPTLADALAGGLNPDNRFTLALNSRYVDETITVSEEEIAEGVRFLAEQEHQVVEGSGAVGVSALLAGKLQNPGRHTAVVISGGNINPLVLRRILNKGVEL